MSTPKKCPSILVVEDDTDQADLICEALRMHYGDSAGGRIRTVRAAGACMQQDLSNIDVVLLDYNLPDIGGLSLLDRILATCSVPVIFVTGLNDASLAAEAIEHGAEDYVVKLGDYLFAIPVLVDKAIRQHQIKLENQRLQQQLQQMLGELQSKNLQLEASLQKLQTMATTDHLTGLANRRQFVEVLSRAFGEAQRYDFDLSCCMCDLDQFKQLNDAMGHQVGDEMLVLAADIIRSSLRGVDTAARYGGDEFILLLPHTSIDMALSVCHRIRQQLSEAVLANPRFAVPVTLSVGAASLKGDRPISENMLVSMADQAMYQAKGSGRNRIVSFAEVRPSGQRSGNWSTPLPRNPLPASA